MDKLRKSKVKLSCALGVGLTAITSLGALLFLGLPASAAELRMGAGSWTIQHIVEPLREPFEKATGITLQYTPMNAREAVPTLLKGGLDVIVTSQPADVYLNALERGEVTFDRTALRFEDIAHIPLSVIVNKSNTISSLSKEQMRGVFSGRLRSWEEVGGPDEPIDVFYYSGFVPDDALEHAFAGDGSNYEGLVRLDTPKEARSAVASSPASIGVIPSDLVDDSVKKVDTPEVAQLPAVITKGEPSETARKFIDFVKGEGQKYLKLNPPF